MGPLFDDDDGTAHEQFPFRGRAGGGAQKYDWLNEGQWGSDLLNKNIYGINAISGLHDTFQINLGKLRENALVNVTGMAVAASLTYSALLLDPINLFIPNNSDEHGLNE